MSVWTYSTVEGSGWAGGLVRPTSQLAGGNHKPTEEASNHMTAFSGQVMPWEMGREEEREDYS